jgi:exopolysaccharide production protein ExoZ
LSFVATDSVAAVPDAVQPGPAGMMRRARNDQFDLLRGLAILLVICVHSPFKTAIPMFDAALSSGRFGVQLFYFVSAMTMCYMWEARQAESNRVLKFYIRRFLRIAPLFWLTMAIYLAVNGRRPNYWAPEGITLVNVASNALFVNGFWPDSINAIVPGGWSIAVEMTFYALFPPLITRVKDPLTIMKLFVAASFANLLIIRPAFLMVFKVFASPAITPLVPEFLYLNFFNQAPIFLLGIFIYTSARAGSLGTNLRSSVVPLTLWMVVTVFWSWFAHERTPLIFAFVVLIEFAFVIAIVTRGSVSSTLEAMGRRSYAIYLAHFGVLQLVAWLWVACGLRTVGVVPCLLLIAIAAVLCFAVGTVSERVLEKPIHLFAKRLTSAI